MYPRRPSFAQHLLRRAAIVLAMLLIAAGADLRVMTFKSGLPSHFISITPAAHAQSANGQELFEQLQAELGNLEQAEDFTRVLAYRALVNFLPAGTRMTSGYRSPQKQAELIRDYARRVGIRAPDHVDPNDPQTWMEPWQALRGRGYIIASPNHTPHGKADRIVFDIAGPDLYAIERACRVAERNGKVSFLRPPLLEAKNGCVHIEVQGFPDATVFDAMNPMRPRRATTPGASGDSFGAAATPSPESVNEELKKQLEDFRSEHDATGDPLKKIDYDRLIIQVLRKLNPSDVASTSIVLNEIKEHQQTAEKDALDETKRKLMNDLSAAQMEGNEEAALTAARELADKFPDEAKVYKQLLTRHSIRKAIDAFYDAECYDCGRAADSECERPGQLIAEALVANPDDAQAKRIRDEIDRSRSSCGTKWIARLVVIILLVVGLGIGLYFLLRPGKYILEGIVGPCKGEVFQLDRPVIRVGAMTSSEDEEEEEERVDIVISDRNRKISRMHCLLRQNGRHWDLKDESSNGTLVNDQIVEKGRYLRLRGGDEISLADEAVLVFRRR